MRLLRGRFTLPDRLRLTSIHKEDALPLDRLAAALKRTGVSCGIIPAEKGHIVVRRNKRILHPEGYELTINRDGVEIVSSTSKGAYYGIQTLIDLLHLEGRHLHFRRIEDWPTFNRRGVYHDCSRGKVPKVGTVKALVERLAHWKINELHSTSKMSSRLRNIPISGKASRHSNRATCSKFRSTANAITYGSCRRSRVAGTSRKS